MLEKAQLKKKRRLQGIVVSDRMQKTVVVAITRYIKHKKYQKYHKVTKRFKVHDEKGEYHVGDEVVIEETRPLSREKRWRVVELVNKGSAEKSKGEIDEKAVS